MSRRRGDQIRRETDRSSETNVLFYFAKASEAQGLVKIKCVVSTPLTGWGTPNGMFGLCKRQTRGSCSLCCSVYCSLYCLYRPNLYQAMERICQDCGSTFEGRADAQFCSDACRIRTRRKQKLVASEPHESGEVTGIPAGMVLIDESELANLRTLAAQAGANQLGPQLRIDYSRLSSYLSDAKAHFREHYPTLFEESPTDVDQMLDRVFGKNHKSKLPSMVFTVNINLAKSALTPD